MRGGFQGFGCLNVRGCRYCGTSQCPGTREGPRQSRTARPQPGAYGFSDTQ